MALLGRIKILVLCMIPLLFSSALAAVDRDGDINLDAKVNTVDLLWGMQTLLGQRTLTPTQQAHGDVAPLVSGVPTPNGVFDLGDELVIERKVLGSINFSYCGDGIVQSIEQCDDGNTIDTDGCSNSCLFNDVIVPQDTIALFDGSLGQLYPWFSSSGFSDPNNVFSIENNQLHVSGNGWGALTSIERYRDYVLVLEFRWGQQTFAQRQGLAKDAGVLIHSNGNEGGWNGLLMPGLQVQIMDGSLGDFILAVGSQDPVSMAVTTSQVSCVFNNWNCRGGYRWSAGGSPTLFEQNNASVHWSGWDPAWLDVDGFRGQTVVESADGDWNQLVVVAAGASVDVYLNGIKINSALNTSPQEGQIQLEVEFAEYYVRRWELHPLGYAVNPVIISNSLPVGVVGLAYSASVLAAGMSTPTVWSIADGNLPGGLLLDSATGEISGTPTTAGQFNVTVQVSDVAGSTASQVFALSIASDALITTGLVMQLESTQGVQQLAGAVSQWSDQSAAANHLFASGDPQFQLATTPSAQPAIVFDGVDDKLQRTHASDVLTGLPVADADRTIFVVARYHSATAAGGVVYGNGAQNQAFGAAVRDSTGMLGLQGWGNNNDLDSMIGGIGSGWLVQSAVLDNGNARLFKNGSEIAQWNHVYNTVLERFVIAAEIADFGFQEMDVAAVLVYDRALDALEHAQVTAYLQHKYLAP